MTRNINAVASLLSQHFVDIDLEPSLFKINNKLVADHSGQIGLYSKYLGLLHDSLIVETNITKKIFSITLNDFTTHVFADAIIEKNKLGIEHDKLIFPIQLDFEIADISFNSIGEEGDIKRIRKTRIDEYLYEQILKVDNENIDIGLVVWKSNKTRPGKSILLLISAKSILLTELQRKAWSNLFGDKYDGCYNYFRTQFDKGRYLSDFTECKKLVDEYYLKHSYG